MFVMQQSDALAATITWVIPVPTRESLGSMKAALKEANQFRSIVPKTNSIVLELSGKLKSIIKIRPMNA
ncbi:33249_t:CDS:2 [Gigaspora margarita]|uniref:33249_t:CDS:1 n=1 Tax=Gigaspora margarita TaxID=4874 RepID=A0ABN7UYL9_GIGMA|nr:33249_t:CDS:2 [Gigaspora margarita]